MPVKVRRKRDSKAKKPANRTRFVRCQKQNGRPSKLTPQIQEKLVSSIRQGAYIETAAAYAGIHKSTLYDWLKRGARSKSGRFRSFSDAVGRAMAESELKSLHQIDEAANFHWQAVAWKLERRFPRRWGRKKHVVSEVRAEVHHRREEAQQVMKDPKARELAIGLFERVAETSDQSE